MSKTLFSVWWCLVAAAAIAETPLLSDFVQSVADSPSARLEARTNVAVAAAVVSGMVTMPSPDGSHVTEWDASSVANGWHEVSDVDEKASLLVLNPPDYVVEGGRIDEDASWTGSAVHWVRNWVVVPNGVTLTVKDGAVVKFGEQTGIKVENGGKVDFQGRSDARIVLTHFADDTDGGDSDFGRTNASYGCWSLVAPSGGTVADVYTHVRYGKIEMLPTLSMPERVVAQRDEGKVRIPVSVSGARSSRVSLHWRAIDGTAKRGVDFPVGEGEMEWSSVSSPTAYIEIPLVKSVTDGGLKTFRVEAVSIEDANPDPQRLVTTVEIVSSAAVPVPVVAESEESAAVRIENRAVRHDYGARIVTKTELKSPTGEGPAEAWDTTQLPDGWTDVSDGSETLRLLVRNDPSVAIEGGRLDGSVVWSRDVTHVVRNWVVVPNGCTLTISAGAVVKFCESTGIKVEAGGRLECAGTAAADVVLTSISDDTVGGDTDLAAVAPSYGNYRINVISGGVFADTCTQLRFGESGTFGTASIAEKVVAKKAGGVARIPILVSTSRAEAFAVDWVAHDGTAKFGEDYLCASGRVTWASASTGTAFLEIPLDRLSSADEDERFTVELTAGLGVNLDVGRRSCDVELYDTRRTFVGDIRGCAESEWCTGVMLDSDAGRGVRFVYDDVPITYSTRWADGGVLSEVTIADAEQNAVALHHADGEAEGLFVWSPAGYEDGRYDLAHGVIDADGSAIESESVTFIVNRSLLRHGGVLANDETWADDSVHLVYEPVVVPSGVTLTISPNAIVKFMPGTGIAVANGGLGVCMGAVFTHAYDDKVGGDTFFDGDATAPSDGEYALTGDWEYDEATQYRYEAPVEASGTLTGANLWRGYRTYRVKGDLTLANGASLDIEAGAVVKFDEGRSLKVNSGATLNVLGRRSVPVVFTSVKDDAHGGDTNQDGELTHPQAGDWSTIAVRGGVANFEFAQILYSSKNNTTGAISMNGGKVSFADGLIAHGLHDAVGVESGDFSITNSVIVDCLQAFRHWAKDPIVNCVIYDCGRLTQGGGQHFVNCVFSKITETWEAFNLHYNGTTYTNCCFWNEGGSVLTAEGTQDAMTICGKDGNIWGDPLFEDPEAGNFRLRDRSPCIDAGDGTSAPERDTFGNPRQTIAWIAPSGVPNANGVCPDIGVHEYQPREVSSDVDLTASSLDVPAEVTVGMPVTIVWQVSNEGSAAAVGAWTDRIQFVDATGKAWTVAESEVRNGLAAGGVSRRSKTFPMPSVPPGTGRFRIVVNVDRGVFEGSQTENNVLDADADTDASLATVGCDGTASVSIVGKGTFAAVLADGVATVRIPASEAEQTLSLRIRDVQSGTETVAESVKLSDGSRVVSLPRDCGEDVDVTVVVVNGSPADVSLKMETEAWGTSVDEATPDSVPNSSSAVVTLYGTCLDAVSEASLDDVPAEIVAGGPNQLTVRVDARGMEPGEHVLTLRTDGSSDALTCPIAVYKTTKGPKLKLEFEAPQQIRVGRRYVGWLKYSNVGDEDMPAPCLAIKAEGAMLAFGDLGSLKKLTFLAIGRSEPHSVLKAGESVTRQFYYTPSGEVKFTYGVTEETGEWAETCAAMRRAADVLNRRGREAYDFCTLTSFAAELDADPTAASAVCGTVTEYGEPKSGVEVVALAEDGTFLASDVSDENGRYVLSGVDVAKVATVEALREPHAVPKAAVAVGGLVRGFDIPVVPQPHFTFCLAGLPDDVEQTGWYVVEDSPFDGKELASGIFVGGMIPVESTSLPDAELLAIKVCLNCGIEVEECLELDDLVGANGLDLGTCVIDCAKEPLFKVLVKDAEGNPAEDACVFLRHAQAESDVWRVRTTTSEGICYFNGLEPGPYSVVATAGGCGVSESRTVEVPEMGGSSCEMTFPGTVSAASVSGTYAGDGEETMVLLADSGRMYSRVGSVDVDGHYEVKGLEPGTYAIWACDADLRLKSEIGELVLGAGEAARYDFAKAPMAAVSGRVRTATESGSLESGTLILTPAKGTSYFLKVGADGSFDCEVPVGSYRIRAMAAGCVPNAGYVDLSAGAQHLELTLKEGCSVRAELPSEALSNGCAATVVREGSFECKTFVDESDLLTFGPTENGTYRIFASSEDGCWDTGEFAVHSGEMKVVPMTACTRTVSLNLVGDAQAVSLVDMIRVECLDASGIEYLLDFDSASVGKLTGLPEGKIRISAMRGADRCLGTVDVAADATSADLSVSSASSLVGTFHFGSRNVILDFNYEDGRFCSETLDVPCGEYRLADVPSGYSSLTVRDDSGAFATLSEGEFETNGRTVCLDALANLPVTVRVSSDADGQRPVFGALVRIFDATSNCVERVTDFQGIAKFRVREGTYSVCVTDDADERIIDNVSVTKAVDLDCRLEEVSRHANDWISITRTSSLSAPVVSARKGAGGSVASLRAVALGANSSDWWIPPELPKDPGKMTYRDLINYQSEFERRADRMDKPNVPCESDANVKSHNDYLRAQEVFREKLALAREGAKVRHRAFWNFTWGTSLKAVGYVPGVNWTVGVAAGAIDTWRGMHYAVDPLALGESVSSIGITTARSAMTIADSELGKRIAACGQQDVLKADRLLKAVEEYRTLKNEVIAFVKWAKEQGLSLYDAENYEDTQKLFAAASEKLKKCKQLEAGIKRWCKWFGYDDKVLMSKGWTSSAREGRQLGKITQNTMLQKFHISDGTVGKVKRALPWALAGVGLCFDAAAINDDRKKMMQAEQIFYETVMPSMQNAYLSLVRAYEKQYADCNSDTSEDPSYEYESKTLTSDDPNEIDGPTGRGEMRCVGEGDTLVYTVYFENKATADVAAQEIRVTNPLDAAFDWSTLSVREVAFCNQTDTGLAGKCRGASEVALKDTSYRVRTEMTLDEATGVAEWYIRIVDKTTPDGWPKDVYAGVLPPNDAAHNGEGHITYSIRLRDGLASGRVVENKASIVFDTNEAIVTDPAWRNTLASVVGLTDAGRRMTVTVNPNWQKNHLGAGASAAQVASALEEDAKNGLKVWQCLVLGLDPEDADDQFLVDVPQNDDPETIAVRAVFGKTVGCWVPAVTFRLDGGASHESSAFGIDIGGETDPTGIYQVKAVFADDEGDDFAEVPAANQIGILRKVAANKREIVPVPWTKFAAGAEDIAVSNLVKTAGLSAGDKLYVYDDSAKRYATWELQSDKTWKPVKTVKMVNGTLEVQTADLPEVATVKRGNGVWLERQDTSKPIVLVGQYEAVGATTVVAAGTAALPSWNLIASPAISNWNLNAICDGVGVKDRIIVPTGKEPRIYTRDAGNTKWGYITYEANDKGIVKPVRKEDDTLIAPGTGLWYISEGGAPVIKW